MNENDTQRERVNSEMDQDGPNLGEKYDGKCKKKKC
jgi:hypothetical protein